MEKSTLEVNHLCTSFFTEKGQIRAVNDVSISVPAGSIIGIVGESGCGKSMTARSIMQLLKHPSKIVDGSIMLGDRDLTKLNDAEMADVRGKEISMIFQEPMTSLNPVMKVGKQVQEAVMQHQSVTKQQAREQVLQIFEKVGISDAEKRYECYPHELSGGLRQRVMIAMAMVCRPKLLIADEPTTALDVTVEAQILDLMLNLRDEIGTSIILISHNLGVIAEICDYVYVMYAGRIVEQADTFTLFDHAQHPYTLGLLNAVNSLERKQTVLDTIPGSVPNLANLPSGCSFSPRCAHCTQQCTQNTPALQEVAKGHLVRCYAVNQEEKHE